MISEGSGGRREGGREGGRGGERVEMVDRTMDRQKIIKASMCTLKIIINE